MVKKLKIYLDTNIIYGLFKSIAELAFKGKPYKENWKLKFIENNLDKIDPQTSFFTIVEIIERLRSQYKEIVPTQIKGLIEFFKNTFHVEIMKRIKLSDDIINYTLSGMGWKDSIHLEIAKQSDFLLITEDRDFKDKGSKFYTKIYNFRGLIFLLQRSQ